MRLVSLSDVYDLREDSANITGMGIVGYLVFWSSNAFVPFFYIWSFEKKDSICCIGVCLLCITLHDDWAKN